jgi:hypothetical protein
VPRLLAILFCVLCAVATSAQQRSLTLDDIYSPAANVNFSGTPAPAYTWIDGDHYAWPRPQSDSQRVDWTAVNAATGAESPLFDASRAEASLAAIPGVSLSEAANAVRSRRVVFNQKSTAALLTIQNELYVLTFGDARVVPRP